MEPIRVVGGGLAGSEAAWQAAQRGHRVVVYEMRPGRSTGAHIGGGLAELVCSNSLGSQLPDRASGMLLAELEQLGSLLAECARDTAVPAGGALAVDRQAFSDCVTRRLLAHPGIELVREEVKRIPEGVVVIASGPLTSERLAAELGGSSAPPGRRDQPLGVCTRSGPDPGTVSGSPPPLRECA